MKHILFIVTKVTSAPLLVPVRFPKINLSNPVLSRNYIDLCTFFSPLLVAHFSTRYQIYFLSLLLCIYLNIVTDSF